MEEAAVICQFSDPAGELHPKNEIIIVMTANRGRPPNVNVV